MILNEDILKTGFDSEIILYPLEDATAVINELNVQCATVKMLSDMLESYEDPRHRLLDKRSKGGHGMREKLCKDCKYWSFNKHSCSQYDDRHYCNLSLKKGRFDDNECLRSPYENCNEWKSREDME